MPIASPLLILSRLFVVSACLLRTISLSYGAPANDHFSNAEVLAQDQTVALGSNVGATKEPGEAQHAFSQGGKSVWWAYDAVENGFLTLSTIGSVTADDFEMDTVLAVYTGSSLNALSQVAWNDDDEDTGALGSKVIFPVRSGTRYYIAVDGYFYETGADEGSIHLEYTYALTLPTKQAPRWNLPSIDGTPLNSTNFAGQVTLVNFWATWCGPCIDEIPDLIELQGEYERYGFTVIGISVDNGSASSPPTTLVKNFAEQYGINYPVPMARPMSNVESEFGDISAIPTTFLVDRNNNIIQRVVGSRDKAFFEALVKPVIFSNIGLSIQPEGEETVIEWQSVPVMVQVQATSSLAGAWTAVAAEVTDDGTTSSVRVPRSGTSAFYRLNVTP